MPLLGAIWSLETDLGILLAAPFKAIQAAFCFVLPLKGRMKASRTRSVIMILYYCIILYCALILLTYYIIFPMTTTIW